MKSIKCYKSLLIRVLFRCFLNNDNEDGDCSDGSRVFQRDGPLYFNVHWLSGIRQYRRCKSSECLVEYDWMSEEDLKKLLGKSWVRCT